MLTETATVISTAGNRAKVAILRSEACGNCPSRGMCHTGSGNVNTLEVANSTAARPGEKVLIELRPDALIKATVMVYLLPAAAMVAGATAGWVGWANDLGAMAGALAGLVLSTSFLFLHGRRGDGGKGPRISRVLTSRGSSEPLHLGTPHRI